MRREFTGSADWEAVKRAEKWCEENGISVGRMQRDDPRGLLYGSHDIQKWRNLSANHRATLDGTMTGDMRNGPVVVEICERPEI